MFLYKSIGKNNVDDKELQLLINDSNRKLKQNIKKFKDNMRHSYDFLMIEKFKQENPDKVQEIKDRLIKAQPHLKYKNWKDALDKKINNEILPPILEKSGGYFYSVTETIDGKSVNKTYGGYHLPLIEDLNQEIQILPKGEKIVAEIIEDLIDELSMKESDIIKTIYGIPPFNECDIEYLKEEYGLSEEQIEIEHKLILKKLKNALLM